MDYKSFLVIFTRQCIKVIKNVMIYGDKKSYTQKVVQTPLHRRKTYRNKKCYERISTSAVKRSKKRNSQVNALRGMTITNY